jgi:hypothetical protein
MMKYSAAAVTLYDVKITLAKYGIIDNWMPINVSSFATVFLQSNHSLWTGEVHSDGKTS